MTIHAILTVDLNGSVSAASRAKFYEVLKSHHYVKHKLTTLWTVQFVPGATPAGAEKAVREHVALAARTAGITDYEALFMQGTQPAAEWKGARSSSVLLADALRRY
ncbi:TPA: hypothetical protein ACHTCR_005534 [Pseudomonas putida]|uniref:hypothetical protein n=1 Tax=Pseudomonas TaxID=286 RepID=UPI000F41AB33|nr:MULTISPECIES: hypothetical protein [Pseudomonas]MCE0999197.1 hypothetical protein [Pseudomonas sp. NMI1173_11]RNF72807.1 hypothetical protein EFJ98_08915 [Pseudomonas putida]